MSRTYNTMPPWAQVAHRAGRRLPADWREPIHDPIRAAAPRPTRRAFGRWARQLALADQFGGWPPFYGPGPLGGKWGVGEDARRANRAARRADKAALASGHWDVAPPRPRHSARWHRW